MWGHSPFQGKSLTFVTDLGVGSWKLELLLSGSHKEHQKIGFVLVCPWKRKRIPLDSESWSSAGNKVKNFQLLLGLCTRSSWWVAFNYSILPLSTTTLLSSLAVLYFITFCFFLPPPFYPHSLCPSSPIISTLSLTFSRSICYIYSKDWSHWLTRSNCNPISDRSLQISISSHLLNAHFIPT